MTNLKVKLHFLNGHFDSFQVANALTKNGISYEPVNLEPSPLTKSYKGNIEDVPIIEATSPNPGGRTYAGMNEIENFFKNHNLSFKRLHLDIARNKIS